MNYPNSNEPSIELKKAEIHFPLFHWGPFTDQFYPGEQIEVMGPNGSGKTTFFLLLNGIQWPHSGEILLKNKKLKRENVQKILSFCSSSHTHFFQKISVKNQINLYMSLKQKKINNTLKKELIDFFEIPSLDQEIQTLSSGFKQRLNLLLTLLTEPPILLWDEPFVHLDKVFQKKIKDFITHWTDTKKMLFIYSTHQKYDLNFSLKRLRQ
ncbi:MAG: hypothetical protein CL678_18450 [Bdellovibrionaceae bacterium]|nr:hypothetical protein [Pseudobdellovibrionaceae bacterium]|tara:strand:+ start:264 stop:893 length:630 start_codon:yes stop_codon:yes gene_type:complete